MRLNGCNVGPANQNTIVRGGSLGTTSPDERIRARPVFSLSLSTAGSGSAQKRYVVLGRRNAPADESSVYRAARLYFSSRRSRQESASGCASSRKSQNQNVRAPVRLAFFERAFFHRRANLYFLVISRRIVRAPVNRSGNAVVRYFVGLCHYILRGGFFFLWRWNDSWKITL